MPELFQRSQTRLYTTVMLACLAIMAVGYCIDRDLGMTLNSIGLAALFLREFIAPKVARGALMTISVGALPSAVVITWLDGHRWYPIAMGTVLSLAGAYYAIRGWNLARRRGALPSN